MSKTEVLIIGAGPTGLSLALWLTAQGVAIRIVDKSSGPGETSRAMAVQARTLEMYRQLDMAEAVVEAGHKIPMVNMWARGKHRAQIPLADAGRSISPYPFVLVFAQDRHEKFLLERLVALGVEVERQTEFLSFEETEDHILGVLKRADGTEEHVTACYLAGCDGARSVVRHEINGDFAGGTYKQLFYVADVIVTGIEPAGQVHVAFDKSEFLMLMAYGETDQYRLIGTVRDDRPGGTENLTFEDVGHDAINGLNIKVSQVNWFSTYHVHHRVADHFQCGRAFLLGDAAHVHSPAGGQGMNTGILDAINLAWKLASVLKNGSSSTLLLSYEIERQAFARKLVETTDKVFTFATAQGGLADFVRTRIAPSVASLAYRNESVREYVFRTVSQITLHYQESPLSTGKAGSVAGGDRLPWVRLAGEDNYDTLCTIGWQLHVYGEAAQDIRLWSDQRQVPLRVFAWSEEYLSAGLARNALYLLRPDSYIALSDPAPSSGKLDKYFADRNISLPN